MARRWSAAASSDRPRSVTRTARLFSGGARSGWSGREQVLEQRSSASIDVLDLVEVAAAEEDCSQLAEVESHLVMLGTEGVLEDSASSSDDLRMEVRQRGNRVSRS